MKLLLLNAAALVLSLAMFALWRSGLALMPLGCGITLSALYAVHRRYPNRWTGGLVRLARQIQAWRFGKTCRFIPRCQVPAAGSWRHLFANAFFQLHASDSGVLRILDRDGRPIISALWLYADTSRGKLEMLRCTIEAAPTRDGMRVTVRAASENLSVEMRLSTQHDRAALDWEVDTSFLQDTTVRRIALVAQSAVPASELYVRNGITYIAPFVQAEYWLDREGARFGAGPRSFWLYHVPDTSSLQVDPSARQLWINLDYFMDHPSVRIPFRQDGTARWHDASQRVCKAGETLRRRFTLHAGSEPAVLPRLLLQPRGFLATFVWTEHACHTAFPVHRALYYGHSDVSLAIDAVGGFIHHGIPITKSVHYSNDTQMAIVGEGACCAGPMAALELDSAFAKFVQDLAGTGQVEICLHCRDPQSSQRDNVASALKHMHEQFGCVSWIDHIWCRPDGNVSGSRDAFSSEAYVAGTPGFVGDLFEQYGVRYFWNNAYEYWGSLQAICESAPYCDTPIPIATTHGPGFAAHVVTAIRHGLPLPLLWQTPWVSGSAYSWPTYLCEPGGRSAAEWDQLYSDEVLQAFADDGLIYLAHAYPTWAGNQNGCWQTDAAGGIQIHSRFDGVLARMARFQTENKIWFATVRNAVDYWRKRAQVSLQVTPNGSVELTNHSGENISGFALLLPERRALQGVPANWKTCPRGEVCWFDFPPHASVTLSVEPSVQERRAA